MYKHKEQISFFDDNCKVKFKWSVYAVPKYYDGQHIETVINAYTEKQARFLFYKLRPEYIITGIYKV